MYVTQVHIHTQRFHFDCSYTAHFLNVPVVAEAVSAKRQTVADWFELVLQFCLVQINVEHEAFCTHASNRANTAYTADCRLGHQILTLSQWVFGGRLLQPKASG